MTDAQFEGIGAFIHGLAGPTEGDGPPYTHVYRPAPPEPADDAPEPDESWAFADWQRFASIMLIRDMETSFDRTVFGADLPAMAWRAAEELYEKVQAAQAEEAAQRYTAETRRYWSGPDKVQRQIQRAYGLTAAQLGLTWRSAFNSNYRQRQRNRRRR